MEKKKAIKLSIKIQQKIRLTIPLHCMAWQKVVDRFVYAFLLKYGPIDRVTLASIANISLTTCLETLKRLQAKGWVKPTRWIFGKRGRPTRAWKAIKIEERKERRLEGC